MWQLCPKCNGQGMVTKPPYVAGDVTYWTSSSTAYVCDVCKGVKILYCGEDLDHKIVKLVNENFWRLI